ncbi:hypothetical protein MKW98_023057 [Papaver atlanticum]|uniref:Uncharacterized protein n=1 Tax=Papaver atlanticum TaxID=357466 RepID=A0AAD4TBR3_9MAGN|nr:hypothetical protein MKW98_023057 [Papaver atlanticum]
MAMEDDFMDLGEFVQICAQYDNGEELEDYFKGKFYSDGYCDYLGVFFSDDEEGEQNKMPSVGTVSVDATILSDEKRKPDMSGTSMDSLLILHHRSGDEEKTNMNIEDVASEENRATERKTKEKHQSQEHGVESKQNDNIESEEEKGFYKRK